MTSNAREYLEKSREMIIKIIKYKYVMCGRPTRVLHEIIPISHGKIALAGKNRVPLCQSDHEWAHQKGTRTSIPILQEKREEFLKMKWTMRKCHKSTE